MEGVQRFQSRHYAGGTGAQPGTYRQVLLQYHVQRANAQTLCLQRLGIAQVAVIDDVLFGLGRQFVGETSLAGQRESLAAFGYLDPSYNFV